MSFALKPINSKIQRVLERKSKIFSRDTSALETVSTPGEMSDELKKVQSRTTWMRWISGNENPIVILGGVAHYDGAYNLAKGFDQVYIPPNTSITYNDEWGDGHEERASWLADENYREGDYLSNYFKPLAGVKSISTTFEGATKSLRKIIVNWTVYDLNELEILTPHFLSPGKWTLLEMGWNYADKVFDKKLIGDKLLEDDTKFEDFSSVEDIICDNEGDYEILTGVISNFEYSLRDDGGFDCTTTMSTHGISLLDAGKDTTTYNIEKSLKLAKSADKGAEDVTIMLKNNLSTTVDRLDDYFRYSCITPEGKIKSNKNLFVTNTDNDISRFYGEPDNWFIYSTSELDKDEGKDQSEKERETGEEMTEDELKTFEKTQGQSWVRWGWFEDNILSKFMGYVTLDVDENNKIQGIGDIKLQFRSIDDVLNRTAAGVDITTEDDKGNKIPVTGKESVRILCHPKMITTDINKFILVGRTYTLKKAEDSDGIRASHIAKFLEFAVGDSRLSNHLKPFVVPESIDENTGFQEGYLRNIYFNVNWLKAQLKGTQTLREGIDNILNGLNLEYQQYWDFDITGDENDLSLARIVDRNNPRYNVDNFRISTINLDPKVSSTFSCYQFPTWTKDSIVSNMDYTVTIPSSQVAVAALSGGDLESGTSADRGKGDINVQQFVKIMHKSFENQQDKFFKNIVKISDYFDNSEIEKFGNLRADENEKLEANEGPSVLGTVVQRDKELTNPTSTKTVNMPGKHDIEVTSVASAHNFFMGKSFSEPGADVIGNYSTLYTNTGKLKEGGSTTFKEQMLKSLHTSRTTAKTRLVDLLNGIAQIKLTIDGTAGIFPGDAFTSKHLPNHLVRKSKTGTLPLIFQATNVEQALGPDGWKTTITGQPRLNSKYLYDDTEEESTDALDFTVVGNTSYAEEGQEKLAHFAKTKNILGINAHFLSKYQMYSGIIKVHDSDPYWGQGVSDSIGWGDDTIDQSAWPLNAYSSFKKQAEPNCVFDWNGNPNYTNDSKKESYYMAVYEGISVQKAMWHSMYNAILYGIPPEKSYNKTFTPFTSLDKTFNLMSYLMFVSDDLDPTKPTKRYKDSGNNKAKPTYHGDFTARILKHFDPKFERLNITGKGKLEKGVITNLYSPCQWMKKEHLQNIVGLNADEAVLYRQLFSFARITPKWTEYEPPGREIKNPQDITCIMRLTPKGVELYRQFFRMLYDNWVGDDFEAHVSLTNPETNGKDGKKKTVDSQKVIEKFGSMFRNSGAPSGEGEYSKEDDPTTSADESKKFNFKGSNIHTFNFDQEVDKFLTMMNKHGVMIAPYWTMTYSAGQVGDKNAWDVIKETCDDGTGKVGNKAQNWKTKDDYNHLKFSSPTDNEVHEIYLEGDHPLRR